MSEQLREALRESRQKLELYRNANSGEYVGGLEYTQLIKKIDAALSQSEPASNEVVAKILRQ